MIYMHSLGEVVRFPIVFLFVLKLERICNLPYYFVHTGVYWFVDYDYHNIIFLMLLLSHCSPGKIFNILYKIHMTYF